MANSLLGFILGLSISLAYVDAINSLLNIVFLHLRGQVLWRGYIWASGCTCVYPYVCLEQANEDLGLCMDTFDKNVAYFCNFS